jgi:hypothetical protein
MSISPSEVAPDPRDSSVFFATDQYAAAIVRVDTRSGQERVLKPKWPAVPGGVEGFAMAVEPVTGAIILVCTRKVFKLDFDSTDPTTAIATRMHAICSGRYGCCAPVTLCCADRLARCLRLCMRVVWCGVVWCGVVWCGVVWCGVVVCAQRATFLSCTRVRSALRRDRSRCAHRRRQAR